MEVARKSTKKPDAEPKKLSSYTLSLDGDQMKKLEDICDQKGFGYYEVGYARFAFKSKHDRVNIVGYESGKVVIQGKGTEDFVRDVVESEVTGEPRLGYEEFHNPQWFDEHAGLDEAGKGDLFGPLVTACVVADGTMVRAWIEKGVRDSKKMTDSSILRLEKLIKATRGVVVKTAYCRMGKYNELMSKPNANLNRLLAWLHSRSLEDALGVRKVKWGLLDQFSTAPLVQNYLKVKSFKLEAQPRAEADPVVAAASICARAEFLRQMERLSENFGETLLKGASSNVKIQAVRIVEKMGDRALGDFAKMHFKTVSEVMTLVRR